MNYPEKHRFLDTEELWIQDGNEYAHINSTYDYDDALCQQTFTLTEETDVMVEVTFWVEDTAHCCGFIEVDGIDVASTGTITVADGEVPVRWHGRLAAGGHTVHFPCSVFTVGGAGYGLMFKEVHIGKCEVANMDPITIDTSFVAAHGVTDPDSYSVSLTAPPCFEKTTIMGQVKHYVLMCQAEMRVVNDSRQIIFVQVGGATATGIAMQLHFSDTGVAPALNEGIISWAVKRDSYNAVSSGTNPTYEGGAYARFYYLAEPDQTITLAFQVTNNLANDKTVQLRLTYAFSPWIVANTEVEVCDFSKVPCGSTVRVMIEPFLEDDNSKYLKIGRVKIADLSPYYYASSTGADIITATYTFETITPSCLSLFSSGEGCLISFAAVDIK